jgi:hypothetical protein
MLISLGLCWMALVVIILSTPSRIVKLFYSKPVLDTPAIRR